jgi:tetratricopeptide (TPR) repeat protein
MRSSTQALLVCGLAFTIAGCGPLQAKLAFKDGNKFYKEENFKLAVEEYEKVVKLEPGLPEGHFYLASSHQALFRPGKDTEDNAAHLVKAIEHYKKALELLQAPQIDKERMLRRNTLGALTAIYSDDPHKDFETARGYAEQLLAEAPTDPKNLFAMANLFEKFEKIAEAEETYKKAAGSNPQDVKACGALAAFYNKPLWEGRSKFDDAIAELNRCASLAPDDPSGYYKVATFFWDKAFRDPLLSDAQKDNYADQGLAAVDKALSLKPDYVDALVYKGLLYRVKALTTTNPRQRQQLIEEAQLLQKRALDLKKQQQEAAEAAAAAATPAES